MAYLSVGVTMIFNHECDNTSISEEHVVQGGKKGLLGRGECGANLTGVDIL